MELSALALRFKGQQATVKQILRALQDVHAVLLRPSTQAALDVKLAEYAFFPLTHIFNQAQLLSTTCLETAIQCVIILVSKGWRDNIAPEMGRQLLILMGLLAGGQTKTGGGPPTDELKTHAFSCMKVIVHALAEKEQGSQLFNDVGSRNVTDQMAYLLLESITDSSSDEVQFAAAEALHALVSSTSSRIVLASLLPRTASSLTQALRISTTSRRTRKVLSSYLVLLRVLLQAVLADKAVFPLQSRSSIQAQHDEPAITLDESWLRATTGQVKVALTQVMRLRSHDGLEVRTALADLCFMIVDDCPKSLSDSLSITIETLIHLAHPDDAGSTRARLEFITNSQPSVAEIVKEKLYDWCLSLPRTMQSSEDRRKEDLFGQIGAALSILSQTIQVSDEAISKLVGGLVEGLSVTSSQSTKTNLLTEQPSAVIPTFSELQISHSSPSFRSLVLDRANEEGSSRQLQGLLGNIAQQGYANRLARTCLARAVDSEPQDQLISSWLALQCLSREEHVAFDVSSYIVADEGDELQLTTPRLVSDLYAATLPWLTEDEYREQSSDWRMVAIAIECAVLQAKQLDVSYRPELLDTLYPMLSLLGSNRVQLREHAMTGLNLLASACKYSSTSDMLVDNADYLINSVSMKLNAFDMTPQAPQVLLMMIRLCGARIVPQLDDLIGSMFSALDNFHGYPRLVDTLFQVLRAIIDETKKQPQLSITDGMKQPEHLRHAMAPSSLDDIVQDLAQRKTRKRKIADQEDEVLGKVPQRPWKPEVSDAQGDIIDETLAGDEEPKNPTSAKEKTTKLSKSYQLLLSIAQATGPHLTSPAPQVRQTLLQLLDEVSPLLAQDENSFLPLINSVWPVVVPRLLAYSPHSDESSGETAYNARSAADMIATLCRSAGTFMSSRIDDVLPQLKKLFSDLQQGRKTVEVQDTAATAAVATAARGAGERSSRSQVMAALIRLLATVISHVQLGEDAGGQIFDMLAPFLSGPGGEVVRPALTIYNADAVWLWEQGRRSQPPGDTAVLA